jgi:hypothetical protein
LRFGDVVMCVSLIAVIVALINAPLATVFVAALDLEWGRLVSSTLSFLFSALVGGYIFGGKIRANAGMAAIIKVTVLAGVLMAFHAMFVTTLTDWTPAIKEEYQAANPSRTLSAHEWFIVEDMAMSRYICLNVGIVLVLVFIGLYVGSMLRKPSKS